MIVSAASDFRAAAARKLPRFLFDYIDGGAFAEQTMRANVEDLRAVALRQRVMRDVSVLATETELFGERLAMPVILGPVGLSGMFARRGEAQAARAAAKAGVPYVLSTMSVCSLGEVVEAAGAPIWFQLYVLKDRGFMRDALRRAVELGVTTLVFTVDLPAPGARYRDAHSGMSGPNAPARRFLQALFKPSWAIDVGLRGRPHDLGNVSAYRGRPVGLADYMGWIGANFDPSVSWSDLEWVRDAWEGRIVVKGVMEPEDARDALRFGADGVVVSNHGGRQLDGVLSTTRALPAIVDAVGDALVVLADSGVRSGLDVVRMLALGARGVMLGRAYAYALAADGERGVARLLDILRNEIRVAMALSGACSISAIDRGLVDSAR